MNQTTNNQNANRDRSITTSVDVLRSIVAQNVLSAPLPDSEAALKAQLADVLESQSRLSALARELVDRQAALVSKLNRRVRRDFDAAHDLATRLQSARGALLQPTA